MSGGRLPAIACAALLAACSPSSSLVVQLASDLVPGLEVDAARITWMDAAGASIDVTNVALDSHHDLGRPRRLAERALAPGRYAITLELLRGTTVVQARPLRVQVAGTTYATVLMLRDCAGIVCPGAGDPSATACLGGRCVSPECSEEHPENCPMPACRASSDCAASSISCVASSCSASGACWQSPDDSRCPPMQTCDPRSGCVDVTMPADASVPIDTSVPIDAFTPGADGGTRTTACGPPTSVPSFVRDCALATPRAGDMDGDGIPDIDDLNSGNCNALVSFFDPQSMPVAWSDPAMASCTWADGDLTTVDGALLGLGDTDSILVRARFSMDAAPMGDTGGVSIEVGGVTLWCTVGRTVSTQPVIHLGPTPTMGGVTGIPPFSVVSGDVVLNLWRDGRGGGPSTVTCVVTDASETMMFPLSDATIQPGRATLGFGASGAGVGMTLQYVAVFRAL